MPKLPKIWTPTQILQTPKSMQQLLRTPDDENCTNPKSCSNCKHNANIQNNHSPLDKQCPTFIKQKEIVAIKTIERVDFKTALSIYDQRHTHQPTTYYRTLQQQPKPTTSM